MKILNGQELADFIKERQHHQVAGLNKKPHLLIIRDSDNPVIMKYVALKRQYGEDVGVKVTDEKAETPEKIAEAIKRANENPEIDGMILQLPIQDKEKTDELTALIAPEKDVDGLNENGSNFDSATATAILWLLSGYDVDYKAGKIALVGRGKLVGKPLAKMLKNSGCDVEIFHRGDDLTKLIKFATIITATGVPGLISSSMVSPGAILVDAGTASEGGILKGDLDEELHSRTDLTAITPEKGGVGPLTVVCLFDHVIQSALKKPSN